MQKEESFLLGTAASKTQPWGLWGCFPLGKHYPHSNQNLCACQAPEHQDLARSFLGSYKNV